MAAAKEVVAEGSKRAMELDKKRRGDVVFFPSNLDGPVLQARYGYLWGREVPKGHGAPKVFAEGKEDPPDSYRFFCAYFICGLCPPFSEFFEAIMNIYGFHLLDFTRNAMATMAIFAHLCENFIGVRPNVDLFCHFFIPPVENDALSRSMSWFPKGKTDQRDYIPG